MKLPDPKQRKTTYPVVSASMCTVPCDAIQTEPKSDEVKIQKADVSWSSPCVYKVQAWFDKNTWLFSMRV